MKTPRNRTRILVGLIVSGLISLLYMIVHTSSAQSGCTPPPSGMVSWWPGEGTANDIQGSNHGALQNGATATAPGMVGQAFDFDGVDDVVEVAHAASLVPPALTVDAWIRPESYGGQYNRVLEKGGASFPDGGYGLEFNPGGNQKLQFVIWSGGFPFIVSSNNVVPLNTWTHVAGVFDGSTMSLYINGVLQGSTGAAMTPNTGRLAIGGGAIVTPYFFDGQIDEVEIINRALSTSEVSAIYNAGSAGKCTPSPTPTPTTTEAVEEVIPELETLITNNPGTPLADKVEDVLAKVQSALAELNKTPPDHQAAMGSIEGAVGDIEAAVKDGQLSVAQGNQLNNQLTAAARQLAAEALAQAISQGGDPSKIADAQQALAAGDLLRQSGKFKDAVGKYKDALSKVTT